MARQKKAYFGLDWIISVILAFIPGLSTILSVVVRVQRENWLGVIANILLFPIFYFIDIVTIILNKDLTVLA